MSNTNPKGMINPTTQGMISGNPQDSAIQQSSNTAAKAAKLNAAVGGTKKRNNIKNTKNKYGGDIVAPQYTNMQYTPTNGPSEQPNSQIAANTQTSTQNAENNKYDQMATSGGSRKNSKKGKKGKKSNKKRTTKKHGGSKHNKTIKHTKNKKGGKMNNPNWRCYS